MKTVKFKKAEKVILFTFFKIFQFLSIELNDSHMYNINWQSPNRSENTKMLDVFPKTPHAQSVLHISILHTLVAAWEKVSDHM